MLTTHTDAAPAWLDEDSPSGREVMALAIAWSPAQPTRVGEVALLPAGTSAVLGRDESPRHVVFGQQRPQGFVPGGRLGSPGISREQLVLEASDRGLHLRSVGRCRALVNGRETAAADLVQGDVVHLANQLVLLVTARSEHLAPLRHRTDAFAFGGPDRFGLVGESPAAWALRDQLGFAARRAEHVLLLGPSGSGKELAARTLHGLSDRAHHELVSRNAATLPEGLIDAELFGNVRGYPNPGMEARPGLVGQADGSSLFLDEIGELPAALQAHLLRVLDAGGEYQRLGDATVRRSDLRLVAATNRGLDDLKHDLVARLLVQVTVPGLEARREDVPLVARALLRAAATTDAEIGSRWLHDWDGASGEPRLAPDLVAALLRHRYTHHVRELKALLWRSMAESTGPYLALTPGVRDQLDTEALFTDPGDLAPAQIQDALDRAGGNQAEATRALGLRSRDQLYRLIKKHGLVVRR